MAGIKFDDLDKALKKKLNQKADKGFALFMALLASLILPLLLMLIKEYAIDRPKEEVRLTYDIKQPAEHLPDEYITSILVENIGRKGTGTNPVILMVEFGGSITNVGWSQRCEDYKEYAGLGHSDYKVEFKHLGPTAVCSLLIKSEKDLVRLPILKYNNILFKPRKRETLRNFDAL